MGPSATRWFTRHASSRSTTGRTSIDPLLYGRPARPLEGDTLLIETTNFRDEFAYRNANAATLRLTERFRRVAPDKVLLAVTVDDPETWTRPWTFRLPLTMDDSQPVLEYACDECNYGLRNILTARPR